jgi:hypothetical protein
LKPEDTPKKQTNKQIKRGKIKIITSEKQIFQKEKAEG